MNAAFSGGTRRRITLASLAASFALAIVVMNPLSAQAVVTNLPTSTVYLSKTYYSTPRYKPATGGAVINLAALNETCGAGGWVNLGMRTNSGASGESTQFPQLSVLAGVASVSFRNVSAPPAQSSIFAGATNYYMNAKLGCTSGTWSGSLNW